MSQAYRRADWKRLGKAVSTARGSLKMTKPVLGHAIRSSSKSVMRLEEGRIYGDPRTAPPGDYNSERYVIRRFALLEMALEWPTGEATRILEAGSSR